MKVETLVDMASRHVQEGRERIQNQLDLINRLTVSGLPTDEACHLLAIFEESGDHHQRYLEEIVRQQKNGERDGAGNLITLNGLTLT